MDKPKLILFDIGGVLIDYDNVFETASKELNIPQSIFWEIFDKYDTEITLGHITPQELYQKCLKENNLQVDQKYDFIRSWLHDYKVIRPTFDFVLRMATQYPIGLFSNIYKGMIPTMLKQKQLPNIIYAHKFISCDMELKKPDENAYQHIRVTTKLNQTEIFFIDDREDFLAPAIQLNWATYKFPQNDPQKGVDELTKLLAVNH